MSATGRGAERRPLDQYFTDYGTALKCCRWADSKIGWYDYGATRGPNILEPHVGEGNFAAAAADTWRVRVVANDVDPYWRDKAYTQDWCRHAWNNDFASPLATEDWWHDFDLVIGNPPYRGADKHIEMALKCCVEGGWVAFLLRLNFLEGQARVTWWPTHRPVRVGVLAKRPSFTGGGTDACAYAMFLWRNTTADLMNGSTKIDWITEEP